MESNDLNKKIQNIQQLQMKLMFINNTALTLMMGLLAKMAVREVGKEKYQYINKESERTIVEEAYDLAEQMYDEREKRIEAVCIQAGFKLADLQNLAGQQHGMPFI